LILIFKIKIKIKISQPSAAPTGVRLKSRHQLRPNLAQHSAPTRQTRSLVVHLSTTQPL
jgi:hypothetical protein